MPRIRHRPRVSDMSRQDHQAAYLAYRLRYLPQQIKAAERKLAALRNEAARYGLIELLEVGQHG